MIGSAPDSARRKPSHGSATDELRHGDTLVKNTNMSADAFITEKRKKKEHLWNANHGKDMDIRNGDQKIKKSRVPDALSEKGREKDHLNKTNSKKRMMVVDLDKKKTVISNDHSKVKVKKKVNTASLEKEWKKKLLNTSTAKNTQRHGDRERRILSNSDSKVKSKNMSTALSEKEKNKEKLSKIHREKKMEATDSKTRNHDSGVKKMQAADSKIRNGSGVNKGKVSTTTTFCDKEKKRKRPNGENTNGGKNTQGDSGREGRIMSKSDSKVKSKNVSTALSEKEKNKEKLSKIHREKKMEAADSKTRNHDSGVKKMQDADSKMRNGSGVNKGMVFTTTIFCDKEKKKEKAKQYQR